MVTAANQVNSIVWAFVAAVEAHKQRDGSLFDGRTPLFYNLMD